MKKEIPLALQRPRDALGVAQLTQLGLVLVKVLGQAVPPLRTLLHDEFGGLGVPVLPETDVDAQLRGPRPGNGVGIRLCTAQL